MARRLTMFLLALMVPALLFAQSEIKGRVTDASSREALVGATVSLLGTTMGSSTDAQGNYTVASFPPGTYSLRFAYVGYVTVERKVTVRDVTVTLNVSLDPTTVEAGEVVVEVNRARDRETPVAFSNVGKMEIEQKISGQDAPLLVQGTPGVYAYSTDGVGNGEAKVLVRGFSQNYVQVLINGVPTNDPESNSVYWSNWGSVSSSAASIQVQRGAGSSLYGSGAFGGSFNIVTADAPAKPFYGVNLNIGDPKNLMYGVDLNTGLINNRFAAALRVDKKIAEGSRKSGRYEGLNYYTSVAWFPAASQSLKLVLHGAPQEHGYSYSSPIAFFRKYGWDANGAPFIPRGVVEKLPVNALTKAPSYGLLDDSRELVDPNYVNISHNFFHKTQLELHYRYDMTENSALTVTGFYSKGRGGGSSIVGGGTLFRLNSDGTILDLLGTDGTIADPNVAINTYLKNANQRISYSFHQQGGILANYDTRVGENLKLTVGGEYRYWSADHPGHFTNLFGNASTTVAYQFRDTTGSVLTSTGAVRTFSRRVYQGDLDGPTSDIGNIFAWHMAGANDATYQTQYRNYLGKTPQYTIFAQGNLQLGKMNFLGSLQFVGYTYDLEENMPSENGLGQQLNAAQVAAYGAGIVEGPTGTGKFLMKGTDNKWYEFVLVNEKRSKSFIQPKGGVNYNFNENLNAFVNVAMVKRFVDLGVFYNAGRVNPSVEDEKSLQFELGTGWTSEMVRAKLNGYYMTWDNKSARITDLTKAGTEGYDRNGQKSELVGKSIHQGVEFEVTVPCEWLGAKGLELSGSFTYMQNRWKTVLDAVKTNSLTGKRNEFNTAAMNDQGKTVVQYFDQLENSPVASGPQTIGFLGLNYRQEEFFTGLSMMYAARNYPLDGGTYMATDGYYYFDATKGKTLFRSVFDNKLPSYAIANFYLGTQFKAGPTTTSVSLQVLNLFDKDYIADADRNGIYPGLGRSVRLNLTLGM